MTETVIVTGGAGFIGSNFVRMLLAKKTWRIAVVDKLTYAGSLKNLEDVRKDPRLVFIQDDIADGLRMKAVFADFQPRCVVNFAAESHVDRSIDNPGEFIQTNIVGTFVLLEQARRLFAQGGGDRAKFRFLHISTDEVYGSLGETGLFSEPTPYAPNSPYAASKASADHLVRAYFETYGLPVLITNCSNNYGPYQFPEKLIPLMILNALEGKPLPIYGDGKNIRDWIHVEDHCAGVLAVLEKGRPGEKYNIGAGGERANLQVVDMICRLLEELHPAAQNPGLKSSGKAGYAGLKNFVPDRPGHDRRYAMDAAKIRSELGWTARYDFESGMRQTVRWYLEHLNWCREVQAGKYGRERLGLKTGNG